MLRLHQDLLDAIVQHARAEHPIEACGILAGPAGGDQPDEHIPMVNTEQSTVAYRFDPDTQLELWLKLDAAGRAPLVIYHSHTATGPGPSRSDIKYALDPDARYVIVSTRDPHDFEVRSWRILDGVAIDEPIEVNCADAADA